MTRRSALVLLGVTLVLLIHFFIRAHNPTQQVFFWDENRHIVRAAAIVEDGVHPAANSLGKFLLYVWLAPFHSDRSMALHMSRTAVALFSLLGSAGLFTLTRRLFNLQAAFFTIIFYAFAPLAFFYERMVLADGVAAAFGVLTAWQSLRLAVKPSYQRGIWAGSMASLAVMSKLTMTFSTVALPVLAVLFLGKHPISLESPAKNRLHAFWVWCFARIRHYWWYLVAAGTAFIVMWLPTLIPAAISGLRGRYYVLVDQSLIEAGSDPDRFQKAITQAGIMLSWPVVLIIVGITLFGLWKYPRRTGYGWTWLLLIWIPALIMLGRVHTRYLMPGTYPLALLFGGGMAMISTWSGRNTIARKHVPKLLAAGILIAWIVLFAWPFADKTANDVTALDMPQLDQHDYFQAPWNGYGLKAALEYLDEYGQPGTDNDVHVIGIGWMCEYMDLYKFQHIDLACLDLEYDPTSDQPQYEAVLQHATQQQPLYLMLEQHLETRDIPDIPYPHPDLTWEQQAAFQRPLDGLWVTVWQITTVR